MNVFRYIALILCFISIESLAQENVEKSPQDALDFISKIAKDFKNETPDGHRSIAQINIADGKMYIYTSMISTKFIGIAPYVCNLYIINLSKVRIVGNDLFADNKQDISTYGFLYDDPLNEKLLKLKTLEKQNKYFIKHALKGLTPVGKFSIIYSYFLIDDPRFIANNYEKRILNAFDYIIKYYGGGNIITDTNSKF